MNTIVTKNTTNTYNKNKFISSEKLCTFLEYMVMGRLAVGQKILLGDEIPDNDLKYESEITRLFVGNCTLNHGLTNGKKRVGWDKDDPILGKYVLEVHTYEDLCDDKKIKYERVRETV